MTDDPALLAYAVPIGIAATAFIDLWSLARRRLLGVPLPDFGLVGRWLAHVLRGRFIHRPIAASPPVRGERWIGWISHYLIGIAFAVPLLLVWGHVWLSHPSLGPALVVGILTAVAPYLLMQPGMGAGIAARRTPRPWAARLQTLVTHTFFGVGLYAGGWLVTLAPAH